MKRVKKRLYSLHLLHLQHIQDSSKTYVGLFIYFLSIYCQIVHSTINNTKREKNFVLRTVDEIVLDGFCLSTAVAGAGVVQRYLVQIIVESAFSESKSVRENFCRSRVEKYSISADDIWLDVVEVSSSCLVVLMFLPQLADVSDSVNSTVHFLQSMSMCCRLLPMLAS